MNIKNIAERALAYGMPSRIVDGNNVVEVYKAAKEAYEIARNGGGPTFIECKTMRMHGHSEHDSAKYVPRELLEEWKKKDPILNLDKYLLENNHAKKEDLDGNDTFYHFFLAHNNLPNFPFYFFDLFFYKLTISLYFYQWFHNFS
ncbi:MAG: thiamine pyrophosphate-dependent enzyme, partial [Planctomycetota bacterium]